MQKLKVGILGSGYMAHKHFNNLKKSKIFEMKYLLVNNRNLSKKKEIADKFSLDLFTSESDFWKQEFDLAVICTPNHLHYKNIKSAFKNNKHVLCEKPLVHSIKEINEIEKTAKDKNLIISVGMNLRFRVQYYKLKEMLKQLGKIYSFRFDYSFDLVESISSKSKKWWEFEPLENLFFLYSGGIHPLDLIQWFFGLPSKVYAQSPEMKLGDIDLMKYHFSIIMGYENIVGECRISAVTKGKNNFSIEIYGDKGAIIDNKLYINNAEKEIVLNQPKFDLIMQYEDLYKSIRNNKQPMNNLHEAKKNTKLLNKIKESVLTKKEINIK